MLVSACTCANVAVETKLVDAMQFGILGLFASKRHMMSI